MIIRIFGITTPIGNALHRRLENENFRNIYCYSRSNKYIFLDLIKLNTEIFKNEKKESEIWINLAPIWLFSKFLHNLYSQNKDTTKYIKTIITCSSTSIISKKFSWHSYDKFLVNKLIKSEESLSFFTKENKINLIIIRPTMVYGKSSIYKDKNISKLIILCKKLPFIIFPNDSGKRQPISISQLSEVILYFINLSTYKKNLNQTINIGGDEILTYENLLKEIIIKNKYNCKIIKIPKVIFLIILTPFLIFNSRFYSEILRIFSDLSGFTKSSEILSRKEFSFSKYIYK